MSIKINTFRTRQKGLTLIELIAGLAIVAAVVVGALSLFGTTSSAQKAMQMTTEIQGIRSAMGKLYSGTGTYGGSSGTATNLNSVLINAGKIPTTLKVSGTTISHGFGGDVNVMGADRFYYIAISGMPQEACMEVAGGSGTWDAITVDAVPTAANMTAASATGSLLANTRNLSVDPARASTVCSGGGKTLYFASR